MSAAPFRHALIMAAGRGQRMMPLTDEMPKAMAPYKGTTLIAQGIERIAKHVSQVHITVGYRGAMLAEHVITHGASSVWNTEGHGNCWWLYNTLLRDLDEPVLVLTCDNVMELDFALLEEEYERHERPACMLVPVEPVEGLEGDYIFLDGDVVTRLDRHTPAPTYCSGIQVVNPAAVNARTTPADDFNALWRQLWEQRELRASRVYPTRWFSVDTVTQLEALTQIPD
ncbi:MAG: nucleotidyl transferase superfamily [Solirubrobacterales bacterium]|nr:nucleotidyl transferase superfamily [Solirubrobacterales bacterium]